MMSGGKENMASVNTGQPRGVEPIPAVTGREVGNNLDGFPVHHKFCNK